MIGRVVDCIRVVDEEEDKKVELGKGMLKLLSGVVNGEWVELLVVIKEVGEMGSDGKCGWVKLKRGEEMRVLEWVCWGYKGWCGR